MLVASLYRKYTHALSCLQSLILFCVRVTFGFQFILTGWGKLSNIEKITGFFNNLGIPAPRINAYMAGSTECFGGLLLLLGLGSRIITVPLAFTMLVAYGTASRSSIVEIFAPKPDPDTHVIPSFFSRFDTFLQQDPMPFLLAVLLILAFGPGKISLDYLICRLFGKQDEHVPELAKTQPLA